MPPCAHTECVRFTGTMENRSAVTPVSATLMAAISPASPPPTIIIFGCLIGRSPQRERPVMQCNHNRDANESKAHGNSRAEPTRRALRRDANRNSPLAREIPQPVAQMKRSTGDSDDVKSQVPGIHHAALHVGVRSDAMSQKPLRVQMPADKNESDNPGPALQHVQPVRHPRVPDGV